MIVCVKVSETTGCTVVRVIVCVSVNDSETTTPGVVVSGGTVGVTVTVTLPAGVEVGTWTVVDLWMLTKGEVDAVVCTGTGVVMTPPGAVVEAGGVGTVTSTVVLALTTGAEV